MEHTMLVYTVEVNREQVIDSYTEQAEAEAFASGYLTALDNHLPNERTAYEVEIVTYQLKPDSADGAVEVKREVF